MNRLKYILRHRVYLILLAIITIILTYIITTYYHKSSKYTNEEEFLGTIYKITIKSDVTLIYIKAKEKLIIYFYDNLTNISLGDTIKVKGKLTKPNRNTIPNEFNYQKYLYNENIFYIVKASKITKIKNNTSIIYYIREKINKRIFKISNNNEYLMIFLLGDKNHLSKEIMDSFRHNGISHLFSISGMHISLFTSLLLYLLKKISYNNFYNLVLLLPFS